MIYSGPRHRGACAITEQKQAKRRFYRPGLRVSAREYYEGLKIAFQRDQQAELDAEVNFMADPSDLRWLRLQHQLLFPRR